MSTICEQIKLIMSSTADGLTPLDIAGRNKSHEAALLFLEFFRDNFNIITSLFEPSNKIDKPEHFKILPKDPEDEKYEGPWQIHRQKANQFTELQVNYSRAFYWAGYYGEKKLCQLFMSKLGISPFMPLFRGLNVIAACVKGNQFELLSYLIKDTKGGSDKYKLSNAKDRARFWKSRTGKDDCGNNLCHYAFEKNDIDTRYKFLEFLIQEGVGDIRKPNIKGQIPHELEHTQPLHDLPDKLRPLFPTSTQE